MKNIGVAAVVAALVGAAFLLANPEKPALAQETIAEVTTPEASSEATPEVTASENIKTATMALPSLITNAWDMEEIKLPNTKGEIHSLSEWKGKVIMLNFWASWCGPCQFEIPRFVKYQDTYADRGLQIIGLGLDSPKKLANVERSLYVNYPTLVIPEAEQAGMLRKWGNKESIVPYTVIINTDGRLEYIHRGSLDEDAFKEQVLPLLSES